MYDEYGMEGIKQNMSADGMNASDIFSQFFGGRGGGNRRRRTDDIVREYPVDLKDLYKGKTAKFRITHKIICSACKGRGGEEGCEKPCQDCRGRGMRVRVIQRGNMIQQSQSPCGTCRGTGKIIDPSKCCKVCNGNKVVPETKTIEVDVEAGMMEGDKVILPSAADEAPGMEAGDVVYVIKEKGSNMFARKKGDLLHIEKVTLAEALCGFNHVLEHLDGHKILISRKPGEVTKDMKVMVIENEGMPIRGSPFTHGKLYIKFDVQFPDTLPDAMVQQLKKMFGYTMQPAPADVMAVTMKPSYYESFGSTPNCTEQARHAYDNDDDDDDNYNPRQQNVSCQGQ